MTSWPSWPPWSGGSKTSGVDAVAPAGSSGNGYDFTLAVGNEVYSFERDSTNPRQYQVYTLPGRGYAGSCLIAPIHDKAILSAAVDGSRSQDRIPPWVPPALANALFQRLFQQQRPGM